MNQTLLVPFAKGFLFCGLSVFVSLRYFNSYFLLASAALISIGLATELHRYLEENRVSIWGGTSSPTIANLLLTKRLLSIFLGILFASLIMAFFNTEINLNEINLSERYNNNLLQLFQHNLAVLFISSMFALLYGAGGLVLILSWNALHWSKSLVGYFLFFSDKSLLTGTLVTLGLLPHLVAEVTSYVLAGMAGIFFAKALIKYDLVSYEFRRVSFASIKILILSCAILAFACFLEIILGQSIFHAALQNL